MSQLVETLGYLGVVLGVAAEGELVVLTATFVASGGPMSPLGVGLAAFAGSVLTYQVCFWLGRRHGREVLARRPNWQVRVDGLQRRIARRQLPLMLGYRLLFGLRAATPFALGVSGVSPWRFACIDVPVAGVWAATLVVAGLALGRVVATAVEHVAEAATWVIIGAAVVIGVAVLLRRLLMSPPGR